MPAKKTPAGDGPFSRLSNLISTAGLKLKTPEEARASGKGPGYRPNLPWPWRPKRLPPTEEELFVAAMDGVQRSDWPHPPHPSPTPPAMPPVVPEADGSRLMQAAIEEDAPLPVLDHPEYIEGWVGPTGKKLLSNLRNGLYSIQGQIDLHGFNRIEAQIAVEDYIVRMSRFRPCCIKIIHGRGINSACKQSHDLRKACSACSLRAKWPATWSPTHRHRHATEVSVPYTCFSGAIIAVLASREPGAFASSPRTATAPLKIPRQ